MKAQIIRPFCSAKDDVLDLNKRARRRLLSLLNKWHLMRQQLTATFSLSDSAPMVVSCVNSLVSSTNLLPPSSVGTTRVILMLLPMA